MRIAESVVEEVKNRLSIIDVVSSYIPVTKKGKDYWVVCPFHDDKNPSMKLDKDRGTYYCFGCKEYGNIFTFVMKMDNIPFYEALEKLAREAGVPIQEESPELRRKENEKDQIQKLYNDLNKEFVKILKEQKTAESKIALQYILNRGFSINIIEKFQLGWSPNNSNFVKNFCITHGANEYIQKKSGLFSQNGYSYFQDRITFPIMNRSGNVVAFSARTLRSDSNTPKYINSAESPIFSKKREFFGFYQSQDSLKDKEVPVICEGNFDVLALHEAGITTALATCGTALSEEQCSLLHRYNDKVKLFFDTDDAGQKATIKAIPLMNQKGITPTVITLSRTIAKDSAELLQKKGKEALKSVVSKEKNPIDYAIKMYSKQFDISTPSGRYNVLYALNPILVSIQSNSVRNEIFSSVCQSLGINESDARLDYNKRLDIQDEQFKTKNFYKQERERRLKKDNVSIWDNDNDSPYYETDLMKCLAFSRSTFRNTPEIRKVQWADFTNPKAAEIFSYLSENAFVGDDGNNDLFLENIEDDGMRNYLSKARLKGEEFNEKTDDEKHKEVIESISRIQLHQKERERESYQRIIELGADTTMGVGAETLREKQRKEIEIQRQNENLRTKKIKKGIYE